MVVGALVRVKDAQGNPLPGDLKLLAVMGGDVWGDPGADYLEGECLVRYVPGPAGGGEDWLDGQWHYLEIDAKAWLAAMKPDVQLDKIDALLLRGVGLDVDDPTLAAGRLKHSWQVLLGAPVGAQMATQAGIEEARRVGVSRWWRQHDELGTVRVATGIDGAALGAWRPDFLGNDRGAGWGTLPESAGISGKPFDEDLGLYWYGARWFDPERGRWISEEPLGLDGPNLYHFVGNDASNYIDHAGLWRRKRPRLRARMRNFAGKAWNAPNTAIGLLYGATGMLIGGGAPPYIDNNSIQFTRSGIMLSAMTLGNVIVYGQGKDYQPGSVTYTNYCGEALQDLGDEERQHTEQGERLGPFYFPGHVSFGLRALFTDGYWYGPSNLLEDGPHEYPAEPWWD